MTTLSFDSLIARADEETLRDLLGPAATRLLLQLDPELTKPSRLRELLVAIRTPTDLIRNHRSRRVLFGMLSSAQAQSLVAALGARGTKNSTPYDLLNSLSISKGSSLEIRLHHVLGIPYDAPPTVKKATEHLHTLPAYPLFPHQRRAAETVSALLGTGHKRVVLHMPTGSGKTRTAMSLIADHLRGSEPRIAVWLAYSEELCDQAAAEFEKAWGTLGNRPLPVFRFWGKNPIALGEHRDGLVVCSLDKIRASIKSEHQTWSRLADRARLVVIDEAHQALAPTYRQTIELLVDRHVDTALLGLTATPGRTWSDVDEDEKLADFFGHRKVTLHVPGYSNPVDYLIDQGYLAKARFEPLTYAGGLALSARDLEKIAESTDVPSDILERLAEDDARNLLILTRAEHLIRLHERVIVFATTAQHANTLAAVLTARNINAASITSETDAIVRKRLIAQFRSNDGQHRILCNFGVLTTGFDAPRISAAIIARPTKSLVLYSQMVGRATRGVLAGGNTEALIVTVVDSTLPGFGNMSEAFTNWEDVWSSDE